MSNLDDPLEPAPDGSSSARFLNLIFEKAMPLGASVIRIEPAGERIQVSGRVNGTLVPLIEAQRSAVPSIVGHVKKMCKMDVAEERLPQNGRLRLRLPGGEATFAVTTLPGLDGEAVVLRRLDTPEAHIDRVEDPP